jgi:multiple sugar transport system permease protein
VQQDFLINIRNSFVVATLATIVSVFISTLAAYSLTRLQYRGRIWVGRLILFSYLTPAALLFIPLAVIINRLQLGNTLHGLIFTYLTFAAPLSTWLLMGFFRGVPIDLEEQAMVDGATRLQSLFLILLPVIAPGLVAVSVFTFTGAWNELLLALIFITSKDIRTIPVALQYLITGDVFRWGMIMAGAVLAALPIMLLYYLSQRFVVQGIGAGAVKT